MEKQLGHRWLLLAAARQNGVEGYVQHLYLLDKMLHGDDDLIEFPDVQRHAGEGLCTFTPKSMIKEKCRLFIHTQVSTGYRGRTGLRHRLTACNFVRLTHSW